MITRTTESNKDLHSVFRMSIDIYEENKIFQTKDKKFDWVLTCTTEKRNDPKLLYFLDNLKDQGLHCYGKDDKFDKTVFIKLNLDDTRLPQLCNDLQVSLKLGKLLFPDSTVLVLFYH